MWHWRPALRQELEAGDRVRNRRYCGFAESGTGAASMTRTETGTSTGAALTPGEEDRNRN